MRSRVDVERDLASARSRLTAAEAVIAGGSHTAADYQEAAAAQAEVQRLEVELAALPPARSRRPAVSAPATPVGGAPPATTATTPTPSATTVTATTVTPTPAAAPVRRRRAPAGPAVVGTPATRQPPPMQTQFGWGWVIATLALVAVAVLIAFLATRPRTGNVGGVVPKPLLDSSTATAATGGRPDASPERTPPVKPAEPPQFRSYQDCMFSYGERRELADGRCDHLPR